MDTQEFYEDVISALSGTIVDVELDEADVMSCFKLAKKNYQRKGSNNERRSFFQLQVDRSQMEYDLPSDINTVMEIIKPRGAYVSDDPFTVQSFNELFNVSGSDSGGGMITYDLVMQKLEIIRMYMIYDTPFVFDRIRHKIRLKKKPEFATCWLLDCYVNLTDEEYMDNLWVFNYTVAEAKGRLGRGYRKFGSLPSPVGEAQLDGDQLVQESKEEKRELMEDIENFMDGDPDGMGVYIG